MTQKDTYRELKLLAWQCYQTTSIFIKAKINFGNLCDQVMPGVQNIVSDSAGRHKLTDLVERYRHLAHILEMGEKRFNSLIAYSGIDAPPYQSDSLNAAERHISKRGNKYLRKTGFEVMKSLIMHKAEGEPVFDFIEKKRSEGKCGREAMIAGLTSSCRCITEK